MLNLFSYDGGSGHAALAGGASSTLTVDASQAALELDRQGATLMGLEKQFSIRNGDAFAVMAAFMESGTEFDVVICDPPAFAASKKALDAKRAYDKLARMATALVKDGGFLGLCSCSCAADLKKFHAASIRGISKGGRSARLIHTGFAGQDHSIHPQPAESGYLKPLLFHL